MTLGVGLQLPVVAQSRIFAEPWEAQAGVEAIVAVAQAADALGLHYLGVCDHVAIPRELAPRMGTTWYDPVATLGFLAAQTQRIRLLTHVWVAPLRPPLQTAKSMATLDVLSGGRLILGVGTGHVQAEFASAGVDFRRRGRLLDQAIDQVRAAWTDPDPDLAIGPRPVQPGGPPVWVGGSSPAALRRAADRGDGWIPQGTPREAMPAQIAAIRERRGARPIELAAMAEPLYVGTPSWDTGRWTLTGRPEEHAERLLAFADLGVTSVQVRLRSRSCGELLDQLAAFAGGVLPLLGP